MTEKDITLGEIKGQLDKMDRSTSNQLTDLFDLMRDVRENGTVVCKQNTKDIESLKKVVQKIGFAVTVLVVTVYGLDKLLDMI